MKQTIAVAQPHRLCPIDPADHVDEATRPTAHFGLPGDGLIVVSELGDALRIRSCERGDAAL